MTGKRVFVTGGAGVIGRELIPRLLNSGAEILVGDLKPKPSEFPAQVQYRRGDLNHLRQTEFDAFAPDILIHLAATFERSTETPGFWDENFQHNVRLTHHCLSLARDSVCVRRLVFASSYLIYDPSRYSFETPPHRPVKLSEADRIMPRNLTGMAKLSGEMELQFLSNLDGGRFSTLAVRIFRGYGRGSRDVISRWVRALLRDQSISVFRPEGIFDYIYAADSAEGLLRLTANESATGIVNLGSGNARLVSDVVEVLNHHFPFARVEEASAEIPIEASEADTDKLRALVDWVPEHDLEDGISKIIDFERSRLGLNSAPAVGRRSIVVTSASRKAPLLRATRDALSRIDPGAQVIAGDSDPGAPARFVAHEFWNMPRTDDAAFDVILQGCLARDVRAVLPTRDGELRFWARHREAFAQAGISVIVSPLEAIDRCLDKLAFAQYGSQVGIPAIPASESLEALGEGPIVVKERFGAGSQGIGLNLDVKSALIHASQLHAPIFQPYVGGREISIDGWLDSSGRAVGVVLRSRDVVVNGESQVTTTLRSPELEADACAVLELLDLRGPVVMQAVLTPDGLRIIEVNPRFGGASTLGISAGLDMLYWSLSEVLDGRAAPEFRPAQRRLRQVRLPTDVVLDDHDL